MDGGHVGWWCWMVVFNSGVQWWWSRQKWLLVETRLVKTDCWSRQKWSRQVVGRDRSGQDRLLVETGCWSRQVVGQDRLLVKKWSRQVVGQEVVKTEVVKSG
jgi:hypothetical protein